MFIFDEKHPKFVLDRSVTKTVDSMSTGETVTLYQIVYRTGERGGFVDNENCLSQEGTCRIHEGACVFENSEVSEDAQVFEGSTICDCVDIRGNATVKKSEIYRSVDIKDATIKDCMICCSNSSAHIQIYWKGKLTGIRIFSD